MKNLKPLMKRVCAYMIDLFIVMILASLVASIPFLNKNMDNYQKTYSKYEDKYNIYSDYIKLLDEYYEDKEINEEEYNKLIENETYKEIIISKYEDNKITSGEYKKIVEEVNNEFDKIAKDYTYILGKEGISNSIITLVCTLLYFGVFQYFLKGQTIGKKLLKLKVVSASNKKITILNYILRSLIVNDVLLNTISIIFLITTSKKVYTNASDTISLLISITEAIIIFLVMTREDGRGLHDLLFNTKVISLEKEETEQEESNQKDNSKNKIIEAEYKEEGEEEWKKKQTKKNKKK